MTNILLVGFGGFFGAIARFGISNLIRSCTVISFPISTLIVNSVGCFAIGIFFEYFRSHPALPTLWPFISIGFLGAFTTFSAFSLETLELYRNGSAGLALVNVIGSLVLCFSGVLLGSWIGALLRG